MKQLIFIISIIIAFNPLFAENKVEMMVGDVKLQPQGSASWQKISNGQVIRTGEIIQTGKKSFVMINADGNNIKIQANTKVKFTLDIMNDKQQSSMALFGGSVNCKMDKLKKNNSGYNVNTAASTCAVRGTEFDVAAGADGKTILQVTDGVVALSGNNKSVDVSKDQESAVAIGGEPEPVKIIKRQDWEKWAEETTNDVKGKEKDILNGCLVKIQKLDSDIQQLEKESAAAKSKSDILNKQSAEAKNDGDEDKAMKLAGEAERSFRLSSSFRNKASYQASRIELVKEVSDNAYNSAENKKSLRKSNDLINKIYNKHFLKYIKPILDSEKLRQEIRESKKNKK